MSQQDPTSTHDQSNQLFFSEGKCVTEIMYTERLQQVELEENLRSTNGKFTSHNLKNKNVEIEDLNDVEGRRIINVKHVGEQMFCWSCKSTLSLMDINEEKRYGVASIFDIPCRMCNKITSVTTDKQHKVDGQSSHFDCNTEIVIGKNSNNLKIM